MSRASAPPTCLRRPARGLLPALGLALLGHALMLLDWTERELPPLHSAPLLLRLKEAPAPLPKPAPQHARNADRPPEPTAARAIAEASAAAPEQPLETSPPAKPAEPDALPQLTAQDLAVLPPEGEGVWRYRLRQAGEEGQAWLHWRSQAEGYELQLQRRLPSRPLPGWRSEGARDALGLAPLRFTVLRGRREVLALNFRREQGLISYSASSMLQPLPPAAQDRLSWWLQLPALLQAWQAQHGAPLLEQGFEIPVALIRGGLHRWTFRVLGQEAGLWHLRRGGLGPHDTRLDVWLDPARQYLPVRLHQQIGEEEGWEMELEDALADPAALAPA